MKIYISDLTVGMIQAINQKIAGGDKEFVPNVLYPYAHTGSGRTNSEIRKLIESSGSGIYRSLIVDSGTYVMHRKEITSGIQFNYKDGCNDYINFIQDFKSEFDYYINYDTSFGYDLDGVCISYNQNDNIYYQEILENEGLNPIYVMHSVSKDEIQHVYDKEYKFVAISSAVLNSTEFNAAKAVVELFYNQGIRTHLLGCASYNRLYDTFAWSCDASSYGRWASFGKMIFFSENLGKEIKISVSQFNSKGESNKDYYLIDKNKELVIEYENFIYPPLGLTVDDIVGDKTGNNLIQANAYYMYWLEEKVNDMQLKRGIDFKGF